MIRGSSGSRSAPVSDLVPRFLFLVVCLLFAGAAAAQEANVLVIDRDRVLTESAPAQKLRAMEQARRAALRESFEQMRLKLEAEESAIAGIRDEAPAAEFEERVRAFDLMVREARRESQKESEALQAEFAAARRRLTEALAPILREVMEQRGASLILDARTVLVARDAIDVTAEVMSRFSEAKVELGLAPPPADDGG